LVATFRNAHLWALGVVMLLSSSQLGAVTVQLSADRTQVGVGDVVSLTVATVIDDGTTASDPELVLPDAFQHLGSRSSTSTSISIVNGAVTQTKTVNVTSSIKANKAGGYTVGPATVTVGGKAYRSKPIRIDVVHGLARPRASSPQGQGDVSVDQLKEIEQNLFIEAQVDRPSVYVGEQILLSYDLYSRYRIQNPKFGVVPSFTGFWAEKVFEASRLEQRPEVVNGRQYNKSRLKQVALFPTLPGTQKLEQLEFICDIPIRSRRRSLFDVDDFFSWDPFRSRQVTVRASDLEVEVKSLPGRAPAAFSGGVGQFEMSATAVSTDVVEGDPVTVEVVVSGQGNLNGVSDPTYPNTQRFKYYDPKGNVTTQLAGTVLTGTKTFEYVVIPTVSGEVDLPPFELAYFDPRKERYVTLKTDSIPLRVKPAKRVEQVSLTTSVGEAVKLVGEDIRFIKADTNELSDRSQYLHASVGFWSLNALPIVGLIAVWQWRQRQLKLVGDVAYARRRRSRGEAQKRLSGAKALLQEEGAAFYAEVYKALSTFLADRLNLDATSLTADQAGAALTERSIHSDVVTEVRETINTCDFARFGGGSQDVTERQVFLTRVEKLIDTLERDV